VSSHGNESTLVSVMSSNGNVSTLVSAVSSHGNESTLVSVVSSHGNVELTADEKARVLELLPPGVNHAQTESIFTVLGHVHEAGSASNEEDISDQDQVKYIFVFKSGI